MQVIEVTMSSLDFVGRKQSLSRLTAMLQRKISSLIVIKGRRRIGKSRFN